MQTAYMDILVAARKRARRPISFFQQSHFNLKSYANLTLSSRQRKKVLQYGEKPPLLL